MRSVGELTDEEQVLINRINRGDVKALAEKRKMIAEALDLLPAESRENNEKRFEIGGPKIVIFARRMVLEDQAKSKSAHREHMPPAQPKVQNKYLTTSQQTFLRTLATQLGWLPIDTHYTGEVYKGIERKMESLKLDALEYGFIDSIEQELTTDNYLKISESLAQLESEYREERKANKVMNRFLRFCRRRAAALSLRSKSKQRKGRVVVDEKMTDDAPERTKYDMYGHY